jgi:farnesyl diphosphate synthase
MAARTSRADFEAVFPQLVEDISQEALKYNIPPNALKWFQKVCWITVELLKNISSL